MGSFVTFALDVLRSAGRWSRMKLSELEREQRPSRDPIMDDLSTDGQRRTLETRKTSEMRRRGEGRLYD